MSSVDPIFYRMQALLGNRSGASPFDLLIFSVLLGGIFLYLHIRRNNLGRLDRNSIPLVIGGWGSRGKSGTERLKAALFNSMGRSLLSKTTGCEPVLLYGPNFGPLVEIPLHRPYEKATIWEQLDVLHLAAKAKVDVFLWECMGLDPGYVQLMQKDWMRDDISTITNTYPDHEDIQGPSGIDVARSISSFIAPGSKIITAETVMYPLLDRQCKRLGASLERPTASDLNCITEEVLGRFPYSEHPLNIAVVLALAKKMGVSQDYALKEMADRIKPDIGVLKVFPKACFEGQTLEFSNGFSANEKFGCLSNWQRLGLDQLELDQHPRIWLTALVNNREDRVTRSHAFAQLLTHDIDFDEFYLVGTNREGFERFYHQSVSELIRSVNLKTRDQALIVLLDFAKRLRIPHNASIHSRRTLGLPETNAISQSFEIWSSLLHAIESQNSAPSSQQANRIRKFLKDQFYKKLVLLPKDTTPQELLQRICSNTPQGFENKVHGMQNIKGLGIKWIELWEELSLQDPEQVTQVEKDRIVSQKPNMTGTDKQIPGERSLKNLRAKFKSFCRPNSEAFHALKIRSIYRDFASGKISAEIAGLQIRTIQESMSG
ncbi:MAG: hypothetical protein H7318_06760 [Oligoflexus sp.]|nr:hypothetical protein [Oligoflexus sp.]